MYSEKKNTFQTVIIFQFHLVVTGTKFHTLTLMFKQTGFEIVF